MAGLYPAQTQDGLTLALAGRRPTPRGADPRRDQLAQILANAPSFAGDIAAGFAPGSGALAKPQQEMRSYDPSWRDRVARGLINIGVPEQSVEGFMGSRGIGMTDKNMGMGLVDMTPLGAPLWLNEAERSRQSGDMGGQMLSTIAAVPIPGAKAAGNAISEGMRVFRGGAKFAPSPAGRYGKSKSFSVSPNRDIAAKYGDVVEGVLPPNAKIFELDKEFIDDVDIRRAKLQGYDAIKPLKSGEDELVILRPDLVQSAPKPQGIRAYHGSPHDFDKKDAVVKSLQGSEPPAKMSAMPTDKSNIDAFEADLIQRHGLRSLSMFSTKQGDLKLNMIAVPRERQGQGVGSAAMQEIADYADRNGLRLVLRTGEKDDGFGTTSRNRLKSFYKRFGFVENKGRNKDFSVSEDMIRSPATLAK